jgi:hypothetical protein
MIVSLTRSDLRDEFCMADEAFALSPISARAALPSEEDYDAISEAFMETSRGRWFLGEYAKRNRNADTRMVLDAVARIEQSLAAQKQPEPEPAADSGLSDAIEAIKAALQQARAAAGSAIEGLALEDHLAPVRKGTRIIHEISWRWREIGADSRICDLIDSQVGAIEASCAQLSTLDPHAGLSAAFDLIARQIAAFDDNSVADPETGAPPEAVAEAAPPSADVPVASAEPDEAATHETEVGTARVAPSEPAAAPAKIVTSEVTAAKIAAEPDDAPAGAITAVSDPIPQTDETPTAGETESAMAADVADAVSISDEDADAHDDAMLDLIAAEMSAPDVSDAHLEFDEHEMPAEAPVAEPGPVAATVSVAPVEPVAIAPAKPVAAAMAAVVESAATATLRATTVHAEPPQQREPEPSIGSALIADGLLRRQAANDPLAALRRLSQAEKIALFS